MNEKFHTVLLSPFDTLFFRDHRPFDAGIQKYSQPLFPTPMTFMGALSQAYFDKSNKDKKNFFAGALDSQLGKYDAGLNLRGDSCYSIKGLFLVDHKAILISVPAHYLSKKDANRDSREYTVKAFFPEAGNQIQIPETDYEFRSGYIRLDQFLRNEFKREIDRFQGVYHEEHRVGIAIERNSNSTEKGALYFTTHQRFKQKLNEKSSFLVCYQTYDGNELEMIDAVRLGGESRLAYADKSDTKYYLETTLTTFINKLKANIQNSFQSKNKSTTFRFMVYLLTPAIFKKGWQPENWPWKERARLVAACVPKPVWVSGFKIEKGRGGRPRPLYKAAPAGSVYFFESEDDSLKSELLENFILGVSVSEVYPQAGFGMTLINSWEYST